jgi:hypothetical protein
MADVLTQHNNDARTGANLNETALTPDKLKLGKFGKLCFRLVDGNPYAQPLYASHIPIKDIGPRNVVIIATEHNSVFAFDADDTDQHSTTALLWKSDSLGPSVPSEVLSRDIARGDPAKCVDLTTEIGITSTPVISPDKTKMYIVAKTLDEPGHHYRFRLHVLRLADGKPAHAPVVIEGEADGAGKGSKNGKITFDPKIQLNRPGLLMHDNVVYICFGSHCDKGTFHGWLFAYNATTLGKIDVFNTTPNTNGKDDGEAGIWQSGQAPAVDDQSHVYFATGDGGNNKSTDFGNSVVKIKLESGKFKVKDWFTPKNEAELKAKDVDLGSVGPVLLPDSHLLLAAGKEGRLYLIDRNDMGKGVKTSLHSFQVTNGFLPKVNPRIFWNFHGSPLVWKRQRPGGGGFDILIYVCGEEDHLKVFRLIPDGTAAEWKFESDNPVSTSPESAPYPNFPVGKFNDPNREPTFMPGGILSLSANGDNADSGIIWVSMPLAENANQKVVRGILRAYAASDVSKELWDSEREPADGTGMFAKFCPPTVADGKVFMSAFAAEKIGQDGVHHVDPTREKPALAIYGLRPEAIA